MYETFTNHLLKILRVITVQDGHLIVVGLKGYGISSLIKIASFICSAKHAKMEIHADYGDVEWQSDIRSRIVRAV